MASLGMLCWLCTQYRTPRVRDDRIPFRHLQQKTQIPSAVFNKVTFKYVTITARTNIDLLTRGPLSSKVAFAGYSLGVGRTPGRREEQTSVGAFRLLQPPRLIYRRLRQTASLGSSRRARERNGLPPAPDVRAHDHRIPRPCSAAQIWTRRSYSLRAIQLRRLPRALLHLSLPLSPRKPWGARI